MSQFIVQLPVANSLRLNADAGVLSQRGTFDGKRLINSINAGQKVPSYYSSLWERADNFLYQFYTNYGMRKVELLDCDSQVVSTYPVSLIKQYTGLHYRSDAKFYSIDGKLFVYFDEGSTYTDDNWVTAGDAVALLGRLPNIKAKVGDAVKYKIGDTDVALTTITGIGWVPSLMVQGYLLDVDYTLTSPVDGKADITYNEKEADLYGATVHFNDTVTDNVYFVRLSVGLNSYNRAYTTEALYLRDLHTRTLAIDYRHEGKYDRADMWSYLYVTDDTYNRLRMPIDFYKFQTAGEIEASINDFGMQRQTRAMPYRQLLFNAYNIPSWLGDKLQMVFSHDTKKINGEFWENENYGSFELINKLDLGTYEIQLKATGDRSLYSTEYEEDLEAFWEPSSFTELAYGGAVVTAIFHSSLPGLWSIPALPAWITTDHPTFGDGDEVEFTIATNATSFIREASLIAAPASPSILADPITFSQEFNVVVPEYLEASASVVELGSASGSDMLLDVTASGDYTITPTGFAYTVAKESGFSKLRITAPSANAGPGNRAATITLALISNPSITFVINVTQDVVYVPAILDATPSVYSAEGAGDSFVIAVTTDPGVQWQPSSPDTWLHFPTSIKTGSQNLSVTVFSLDSFMPPRTGVITFVNVNNPSNTKFSTVIQYPIS